MAPSHEIEVEQKLPIVLILTMGKNYTEWKKKSSLAEQEATCTVNNVMC